MLLSKSRFSPLERGWGEVREGGLKQLKYKISD
jgi:hypothetical protein